MANFGNTRKLGLIFVTLFVVSCSSQNSSESQIYRPQSGSIASDVDWGENANTKAAVLISFKNGKNKDSFCTGTNIGGGLILTAKHCEISCATTTLTYWDGKASKTASCQSTKAGPLASLIVLESNDSSLNAAGSFSVDVSTFKPVKDEQLRIYYFNQKKKLSESDSCVASQITSNSFQHDCSTSTGGGASGALIVSKDDPSRIIGIHAATAAEGQNGGTFLTGEDE